MVSFLSMYIQSTAGKFILHPAYISDITLIQSVYINQIIYGSGKDTQLPVCIPPQHISTSAFDDDADADVSG